MNKIKITIKKAKLYLTDDYEKENEKFHATAVFDCCYKFGTPFSQEVDFFLETYGATEQEARANLLVLLHQFSDRFTKALNEVEVSA